MYNDAYARMIGFKHPQSFGLEGKMSWGELWPQIGKLVEKVFAGDSIARMDDLLFMDKMGEDLMPEETYHSWSYVPILVEGGKIGGFINQTFGMTQLGSLEHLLINSQRRRSKSSVSEG
jgi:hypothetical protein